MKRAVKFTGALLFGTVVDAAGKEDNTLLHEAVYKLGQLNLKCLSVHLSLGFNSILAIKMRKVFFLWLKYSNKCEIIKEMTYLGQQLWLA